MDDDQERAIRWRAWTAWAWLHKLRRAMVRPDRDRLTGTVEVDEVMIGGVDAGTLHHRVSTEQLPYYLDEYTFRFNRRTGHKRGLLFYRLLQQAVATEPHPPHDLRRPADSGW